MSADLDYILNSVAYGSVAQKLVAGNGDTNLFRPFIGDDNRTYINRTNPDGTVKAVMVANANATLRKNEWQQVDAAVVKVAKQRLQLVNSFRSAGMVQSMPNAWGTPVLQYERQSDISPAKINMTGLDSGGNDRPEYDIVNLPLPVISKECTMDARQLAASRNGNTPLDLTMFELAAEQVAIKAEKLLLGLESTYTYGGGSVYGLTNFPSRITGTFADPAGGSWEPDDLRNDVIAMIAAAQNAYHYGPYNLYYSTGMLIYMMRRYNTYDSRSLLEVLRTLPGIVNIEQVDYFTGKKLLLVPRSAMVARVIQGMDVTTTQWVEKGGLEEKFRVMAMFVPQFRLDQNSACGIVHYTSA